MQFPIVIEEPTQAGETFSAYAPDFDGVVATGDTVEACAALMAEALALHIRGMIEDGDPIPAGQRTVRMVEPAFS
ncbi:MAG TPA: type II toxin-antitoxin system HicB family antitoxin [Rubricoccaceae bacterium]|jgi:predicted RNase H-like HicB family nuclease